ARAGVRAADSIEAAAVENVFLSLVLEGLGHAARLDPPVYGLMARLGRVSEALARVEVLTLGLHKFRSVEAGWRCTPPGLRAQLGPLDGAELLAGAALDVPATSDALVGSAGYDRSECLRSAAAAMAPHDLARALRLIEMVRSDKDAAKDRDAVVAAAVE